MADEQDQGKKLVRFDFPGGMSPKELADALKEAVRKIKAEQPKN